LTSDGGLFRIGQFMDKYKSDCVAFQKREIEW
jgi:hypothetical protein